MSKRGTLMEPCWVAGANTIVSAFLKDADGDVPDLSGVTVELRYHIDDGASQTKTASLVSETTGEVSYQFDDSDLTVGVIYYEWVVTSGTLEYPTELFRRVIRAAA